MQKIYTYARNLINAIMVDLCTNQGFTTKETTWKTNRVEEKLVIFEVHNRIKDLFEKELSYSEEKITVSYKCNEQHSTWEIIIEDAGAESYFFARMLFVALARIKSGIVDIKMRNCKLIEHYATAAAIRANISALGFNAEAKYENSIYTITFPVNGMVTTFSNENVDLLCRSIGLQLRDFLMPAE